MSPTVVAVGLWLAWSAVAAPADPPIVCDLAGGLAAGTIRTADGTETEWVPGPSDKYLRFGNDEGEAAVTWAPGPLPPATSLLVVSLEARVEGVQAAPLVLGSDADGEPMAPPPLTLWLDVTWRRYKAVRFAPGGNEEATIRLSLPSGGAHVRALSVTPMAADASYARPLRNSSFEFGLTGWGPSEAVSGVPEWSPSGGIDGSGCACLRSGPGTQGYRYATFPIPYVRAPTRSTLRPDGPAVLEPGKEYALGLSLRAEPPGTQVAVRVEQPGQAPLEAPQLVAGGSWREFQVRFTAYQPGASFVIAPAETRVVEPTRVWVDQVRVSRVDASEQEPAAEWVCVASAEDGVYAPDEPLAVRVDARATRPGAAATPLKLRLVVEDLSGAVVLDTTATLALPADGAVARREVPLGVEGLGLFRVRVEDLGAASARPDEVRLARFTPYRGGDSPFGVSWGWPSDQTFRTARAAGIRWVRDWSVAWESCEPEEGRRSLLTAAAFLDRYRHLDLRVLECLPFPSTPWSSSTTPEDWRQDGIGSWPGARAYVPDRPELLAAHLSEFARELGTRFDAFEMLTEPLASGWSLPRGRYSAADYVGLCQLARTALADGGWGGEFLGGIGVLPGRADPALFTEMRDSGLQGAIGPWALHTYLLTLPAEALDDRVRAASAWTGAPRMWLTELGLAGADDAGGQAAWGGPSELDAADALVRTTCAALSSGVERLFLVAGPTGAAGPGGPGGDVLFTERGAPRKPLPVLAALAGLLGASPAHVRTVALPHATAYVFAGRGGAVAVVCPDYGRRATLPAGLGKDGVQVLDIAANPLEAPPTGDLPFYLRCDKLSAAGLVAALEPRD